MTNVIAISRPTAGRAVDHHARHGVAPVATKPNEQPGANALACHTRQHLREERSGRGGRDHGGARHAGATYPEPFHHIAPPQAKQRELQHGDNDPSEGPTNIQRWDGG